MDGDSLRKEFDSTKANTVTSEPIGLALTRTIGAHDQRILVVGDAHFLSNA